MSARFYPGCQLLGPGSHSAPGVDGLAIVTDPGVAAPGYDPSWVNTNLRSPAPGVAMTGVGKSTPG